jgi:hypothetical protein
MSIVEAIVKRIVKGLLVAGVARCEPVVLALRVPSVKR